MIFSRRGQEQTVIFRNFHWPNFSRDALAVKLLWPPLVLSSLTILVSFFVGWEIVEKNFFMGLDKITMHHLYITRGSSAAILLAAWSVYFVRRYSRRYEAQNLSLQAQLFQADKLTALGELIGGVAHEINNPIGVMVSRLELMIQEAKDAALPAQYVTDLEVLHKHARRVGMIAHNLLSFARKSNTQRALISLNDIVRETVPLIDYDFRRRGIEIEIHLGQEVAAVEGNFNQLQQVLLNVLNNARDALIESKTGSSGAKVQIGTWNLSNKKEVRLAVANNGPAISDQFITRIFDPFFTTKEKGTGLGLSVSYGIIKEHHGRIDVSSGDSNAGACGTCFAITLPASSEVN